MIEKEKPYIKEALILAAIALTFASIYTISSYKDDLKKLAKDSIEATERLRDLAKEVSNPGGLVAKIESQNAFLTETGIFELTNDERLLLGLSVLGGDQELSRIADERLRDMFAKGYFDHVSPVGESASSVAEKSGYEYISIGENIALGNFENDAALVKAWMESPGHRANIVSTKFTSLGVAVGRGVYEGRSTWIGVQIFARPISECPTVNASLKSRIDALQNIIDSLEREIREVEEELSEGRRRRDQERYNELVAVYNSLADRINGNIAEIKSLAATYNSQVRAFNACIAE